MWKVQWRTKTAKSVIHSNQSVPIYRNLSSLNAEFREHHLVIINFNEDDEEAFSREQEILDSHDDETDLLLARIKMLHSAISQSLSRKDSARDAC